MVHFGDPGELLATVAEPIDGMFVRSLRETARGNSIAMVFGMFEPGDGTRVYNTVVALGRDGSVWDTIARYICSTLSATGSPTRSSQARGPF